VTESLTWQLRLLLPLPMDSPSLKHITLKQKVSHQAHVIASAPYVSGQGMLIDQGQPHPIMITGVLPELEKNVSEIPQQNRRRSFQFRSWSL